MTLDDVIRLAPVGSWWRRSSAPQTNGRVTRAERPNRNSTRARCFDSLCQLTTADRLATDWEVMQ